GRDGSRSLRAFSRLGSAGGVASARLSPAVLRLANVPPAFRRAGGGMFGRWVAVAGALVVCVACGKTQSTVPSQPSVGPPPTPETDAGIPPGGGLPDAGPGEGGGG